MPAVIQALFLFLLQGLGILLALSFKRCLPLRFVCLSGLLWGSLFWVLAATALLAAGLPYTLTSMAVLFFGAAAGLAAWNIRRGNFTFSRTESRQLVGFLLVSAVFYGISSFFVLSAVSPDSYYLILNGRAFPGEWSSEFIRLEMAQRGIFLPVLQSASYLLGLEYLTGLQPAFTGIFTALFLYLGLRILTDLVPERTSRWVMLVALFGFGSTHFILYQTFYIHTNLLSGFFFLISMSCAWLALQENNRCWIIFSVLSLAAFSLLRTEAPLFSLLFLALLISRGSLSYRERLAVVLPFSLFLAAWYLYLLNGMQAGSHILNPLNTIMIIAGLLGFAGFIFLSRLPWIENNLPPSLPRLLLGGLVLVCAVLILQDPARMGSYLVTLLTNMTIYGLWGVGWFMLLAVAVLAVSQPAFSNEELFSIGIPAFLLLLYVIVTRSEISRLNWGDSANRMLTHIYPTIFFYFALKFGVGSSSPIQPAGARPRRLVLVVTGLFLIAFTLTSIFAGH